MVQARTYLSIALTLFTIKTEFNMLILNAQFSNNARTIISNHYEIIMMANITMLVKLIVEKKSGFNTLSLKSSETQSTTNNNC
jgi:hypothetical protein